MTIIKRILWAIFALLAIIFVAHVSINLYLKRDHGITENGGVLDSATLYFAYGANLSLRYLANIRNVKPEGWSPGILRNYQLTFGIEGLNDLEPGFANIKTCESNCSVNGMVYALAESDFDSILNSEPDDYRLESVPIQLYDGNVVTAKVLFGKEQGTFKPSRRYINIMIEGANDGGISSEYVQELSRIETAYTPVLSELLGTVIYSVVYMQARSK